MHRAAGVEKYLEKPRSSCAASKRNNSKRSGCKKRQRLLQSCWAFACLPQKHILCNSQKLPS